mgnify:CR=1 FL=1
MASFLYRARDASGHQVKGTIEAPDQGTAVARLREQGYVVTHIELNRDISVFFRRRLGARPGRKISLKDLAAFCRQFSTLVEAGVPIRTGLRVLSRQAGNRPLGLALEEVGRLLEQGETLAESFRRQGRSFPDLLVNMVQAGETGGFLPEVFQRLAVAFEREDRTNHKIRSALVYPAVVVVVALGVISFSLTFVLPTFVGLFQDMGASLPLPTRILLRLSAFIRAYWVPLLVAGTVGVFLFRIYARTERGRRLLDRVLLRVPVIGEVVLKWALVRFSSTLATLTGAGIPILDGLEIVRRAVHNTVVADAIDSTRLRVAEGQSLVQPLTEAGIFPSLLLEMLSVGEDTGAMDVMLLKVAEFYEADLDRTLTRLTALLEPAVIVVLAVVVGGIIVSIVLPMFDVLTTVR